MLDIVAGQDEGSQDLVSVAGPGLPGHVWVLDPVEVDRDIEPYGEPELSDAELLGVAAEDAMSARAAGDLGGPDLDEVELRRTARRAHRRAGTGLMAVAGSERAA